MLEVQTGDRFNLDRQIFQVFYDFAAAGTANAGNGPQYNLRPGFLNQMGNMVGRVDTHPSYKEALQTFISIHKRNRCVFSAMEQQIEKLQPRVTGAINGHRLLWRYAGLRKKVRTTRRSPPT
jgi:hypothetical protein